MLLTFDFHNHSCLSPCAQLENDPGHMVERARGRSIDLFALTDHNCALNAPAFAIACGRVCRRAGLLPFFGLELSPFEEAHLLVLFPDPLAALSFSDWVQGYLPRQPVDPLQFGDQVAVDPEGNILSMPSAWFGNPLRETFGFFARAAADAGALVIPAHVDRALFSVFSQLGFLPEGPYDAVEAVGAQPDRSLCRNHCVISGSDAHVLEHIGRRSSALELADTDDSAALAESLRADLARMAEAWEALREDGGAGVAARALPSSAASDDRASEESGRESAAPMVTESESTNIPGMAPIVDFMENWYPRAAAEELFERTRAALRAGHAWSVHRRSG